MMITYCFTIYNDLPSHHFYCPLSQFLLAPSLLLSEFSKVFIKTDAFLMAVFKEATQKEDLPPTLQQVLIELIPKPIFYEAADTMKPPIYV